MKLEGGRMRLSGLPPAREATLAALFGYPALPDVLTAQLPKFKIKDREMHVPTRLITRMAGRLWRLGSKARREAFIARARKRIDAGGRAVNDAATLLAALSLAVQG